MEIDGISDKVYEQYEEIRLSGLTNMLDMKNVLLIAETRSLNALIEFVDNNTKNYSQILQSYSEWRRKHDSSKA